MDEFHLTRELLQAASRGEIEWYELMRRWLNHHHAVCSCCAREFHAWQRDPTGAKKRAPRTRAERLENLLVIAGRESACFRQSEAEARREMEDLLETPTGERINRWQAAYKRFRRAPLAEQLIEEARQRVFADPRDALELASVAEKIARFCRGSRSETAAELYPYELETRALAHQANALRPLGELHKALERIAEARRLVGDFGILDHSIAAELCSFESSIRRDLRDFRSARKLLDDAIMLYRAVNDPIGVARATIILGDVFYVEQRPKEAFDLTQEALRALSDLGDAHLELCAIHNQIFYLCTLDRYEEARHKLEANEWRYRQFDDSWHTLRHSWAAAKIAGGLGEFDGAERLLLETRDGFLAREGAYDAALVSLELALLYLDQGRTVEVKELAAEMLPTFQEKGIHREALAALTLFAQAVETEQATNDLLSHVLAYLSAARNSPGLRFVHPR